MNASMKCGGIFDLDNKKLEFTDLQVKMSSPNFWDKKEDAQKIIDRCNLLKSWIEPISEILNQFNSMNEIFSEAFELDDSDLLQELEQELDRTELRLDELEVKKMLSGELDQNNCYLSVNAGAGGTESCDWVVMLSRMYQRWATLKEWKIEVIDSVEGEVAGLKSITLHIEGDFAYGYAKAEKGVHRLVRISPFDSNARRHTSFASVDVTPDIPEAAEILITPDDVRIDTFRASGAGGQHVNRTDSAVRITHLPTKIVVSCQSQRSQHQNKEACFQMLKSKLYEKEVREREEQLKKIGGEKREIAWGSQIRSYVFQPYTLVKDSRTKVETGNIQAVMDGNIDIFVNAYLKEFGEVV